MPRPSGGTCGPNWGTRRIAASLQRIISGHEKPWIDGSIHSRERRREYDGGHWWTASLGDRIPFPLEAAGFKLTPLIFIPYLLLTRRYRAAATAAAMFAGTVAAGFAVLPASSAWYWAGEFATPGRVSPVEDPENQSLLGVLSRMLHTADVLPLWLPLAATRRSASACAR